MESSSTWWRTHLAFAVDASPSSLCIEGPPGGLAWPSETLMQLVNASVNATTKSALPVPSTAQYLRNICRPLHLDPTHCASFLCGSRVEWRSKARVSWCLHRQTRRHFPNQQCSNGRYTHNGDSRTTYRIATQFPWRILLTHAQSQLVNPDGSRVAPLLYCHNGWIGNCHRDVLREQWWKKSPALLVNPALVGAVMRAMYAAPSVASMRLRG